MPPPDQERTPSPGRSQQWEERITQIVDQYYRSARLNDLMRDVSILFADPKGVASQARAREAHEIIDFIEQQLRELRVMTLEGLIQDVELRARLNSGATLQNLTDAERERVIQLFDGLLSRASPEQRSQLARIVELDESLPIHVRAELGAEIRSGRLGKHAGVFLLACQRNREVALGVAELVAKDSLTSSGLAERLGRGIRAIGESLTRLTDILRREARQMLRRILSGDPELPEPRDEVDRSGATPDSTVPVRPELQLSLEVSEDLAVTVGFVAAAKLILEIARKATEEDGRAREIRQQIQRMVQRLIAEEPLALATAEGSAFSQTDYRLPPTDAQYVQALEAGRRLRVERQPGAKREN